MNRTTACRWGRSCIRATVAWYRGVSRPHRHHRRAASVGCFRRPTPATVPAVGSPTRRRTMTVSVGSAEVRTDRHFILIGSYFCPIFFLPSAWQSGVTTIGRLVPVRVDRGTAGRGGAPTQARTSGRPGPGHESFQPAVNKRKYLSRALKTRFQSLQMHRKLTFRFKVRKFFEVFLRRN